MKKMWAGLLAALMLTAALPAAAYAIGPGEPVYGGPGDSAPAQNGRVVYAYPGFKGQGPQYGQMVNSFTEPAGFRYSSFARIRALTPSFLHIPDSSISGVPPVSSPTFL